MIRILKLAANGDPTGEAPRTFATVEQGQKWAEQDIGSKLEWGEEGRFFSLEGMRPADVEHLTNTAEYPPVRYWLYGVDENGEDRELESADFESGEINY
jgi:hypothetical protein